MVKIIKFKVLIFHNVYHNMLLKITLKMTLYGKILKYYQDFDTFFISGHACPMVIFTKVS